MQGPETRTTFIVRLAGQACDETWLEFVGSYRDVIYRVARGRGLQHADAEDATQEVFSVVARKIEGFDLNHGGSFRGWLRKLARDAAIDRLRKPSVNVGSGDSGVQRKLAEIAADDTMSSLWDIEVHRERLRQACNRIRDQFSEVTWQCFWLTAIEHHSIGNVAKKLQRSEGSVRVARCRVMSRLKTEVQRDDRENSL